MKIPLHSILRIKFKTFLYSVVSSLTKNYETKSFVDKNEIKNIVIVRPNYRIGNLIFLTPLINELYKEIPDAKIDIIVGMKLAGQILEQMPNIDKVIDIPRTLLLSPIRMYKFIKKARTKRYDIAINISDGSLSSEIVTSLVNSKYKASFQNDKTIIHLTHTVKNESLYKHSGSRPLELLKLFTSKLPEHDVELDIKLMENEILLAQIDLDKILKQNNIPSNNKIVALFRNARYDKKIPDEWWNRWHEELLKIDKNITVIDILSPDILTKLNNKCLVYSNKNLRILGAFFKCCDMYISADTGPLHLSCASGAKTVALFNKTDIGTYGTLGDMNLTIDINNLTPESTSLICYKQLTI